MRRLVEVDFPLAEVNAVSSAEKKRTTGTITNLVTWFARRPQTNRCGPKANVCSPRTFFLISKNRSYATAPSERKALGELDRSARVLAEHEP